MKLAEGSLKLQFNFDRKHSHEAKTQNPVQSSPFATGQKLMATGNENVHEVFRWMEME